MTVPSSRNDGLSLASDSSGDAVADALVAGHLRAGHLHDRRVVRTGRPGLRRPGSGERTANASAASRATPYFSPSSSVLSPRLTVHSSGMSGLTIRQPSVVEYIVALPAGNGRSDFGSTYGARVIDSTPPATMIEASPTAIVRAAPTTASRPGGAEPVDRRAGHRGRQPGEQRRHPGDVAVVLAGLVGGAEAAPRRSGPGRATGCRSSSALITTAPRSSGRTFASAPPSLPTGVRTASTTKTSRPCTICLQIARRP